MQAWTTWPAVHLPFLLQWKWTHEILQSLIQVRHTFSTKAIRNHIGWKAPTAWARISPDLLIHCSIKKILTARWSLAKEHVWSEKLCYWNLQKQSWVVPLRICPVFLWLGASVLQTEPEILSMRLQELYFLHCSTAFRAQENFKRRKQTPQHGALMSHPCALD